MSLSAYLKHLKYIAKSFLFGNNIDIVQAMTPEGYLIAAKNNPYVAIVINPAKIMFKAQNVDDLVAYVESYSKLIDTDGFSMNYKAFGINSEYEYSELPSSTQEWMWNRFVNPSIDISWDGKQCTRISFRFVENTDDFMNIEVAPRDGLVNGLYVSVNHHHERLGSGLPCKNDLIRLFSHSSELLENKYFKKIITD